MELIATPGTSPLLSLPPPERRRTPDHPPYAEMIQAAIRTMAEKGGSTAVAIDRYIRGEYPDLPWGHHNLLPHYLRKLVVAGEIEQNKFGRYFLPYVGVEGGTGDSSSRTPELRASNPRTNRRRKPMSSGVSKMTAMDDDGYVVPPNEAPDNQSIDVPTHADRSHIHPLTIEASSGVVPDAPMDETSHEGGRDNPQNFTPEPIDSDDSFETPVITVAPIAEFSREPRTQEDHAGVLASSSEISKQPQSKPDIDDSPLLMLEEEPPQSIKHGSSAKGKNKKASTEKRGFMPFTAYVEREVIIALPCPHVDMFAKKWPSYMKTASLVPSQKPFSPNLHPDEPVGSSVTSPPTVPSSSTGSDAEANPSIHDVIVIEDDQLCENEPGPSSNRSTVTSPRTVPLSSTGSDAEVNPGGSDVIVIEDTDLGDQLYENEPGPSPPSPVKIDALPSNYNSGLETISSVPQESSQLIGHGSVSSSKDVPQEASQLTRHGSVSFSEDVPQEASKLTENASVSLSEDVNGKTMKKEFFGRVRKAAELNREFKHLAESMPRSEAHSDASMLVRWKRRIRKHQTNPVVENPSRISSDLQGAEKPQFSVPETGTSALTSSTSATVAKSVADPVATSPHPVSQMASDQCDTDASKTGNYAGSWQIHLPRPTSESEHLSSKAPPLAGTELPLSTSNYDVYAKQPSSAAASVTPTATKTTRNSGDAVLPRGKRRYTKKQNNPTRLAKSVLQGSVNEHHGGVELQPSSLMSFDQCDTDVRISEKYAGQIHVPTPASDSNHGVFVNQPSAAAASVSATATETSLPNSNHADASLPTGKRRYTKKQNNATRLPKSVLERSGYEQHGSVELEPSPLMEDKSSSSLSSETINNADIQTVGPSVCHPGINQLPSGLESSDSGSPLKRGRKHTSIAGAVDNMISGQEVATESQSVVLTVEERDMSKDAFRTPSTSGYQQHDGVEWVPLMADEFSPAFPTQPIVAADKQIVGPDPLSSKVDLPATKQLPPGTEIIDTPLRRGRGRPPKKKPYHTPIAKTVYDHISQQEAVTNPQSMVLMVEEVSQSENVSMAHAVSGCEQQGGVDLSKHVTMTPPTSSNQQHGGVELEPLPMMPDKCSPAFPTQTIVSADKQIVSLEPPLSLKVDLLATKRLHPGTEISDTPLQRGRGRPPLRRGRGRLPLGRGRGRPPLGRGRGRPPKKNTDHTPFSITLDDCVSQQEIVTNPESMVLMAEEANQSEDVTMALVSGCEQLGGVEPEPISVISDLPSSSLVTETVLVEDILVRGQPSSSKMDRLMINQLPSAVGSSDTTLPKRRGRPPKRKTEHTPLTKTLDTDVSKQEVVTNSQPKVLMAEEGNLPEDAPRTPAVAGFQQHGGVVPEPLPSSAVLPTETVVAADKQMVEHELPSPLKVEILVTKQLPSGIESSEDAVPRHQWKHSRKNRKHNPNGKTKDIDISEQEVLPNSNSVALIVEEGTLAEDASRTPNVSTSTEMLPIKSRGRGRPLKNSGAPKKAETPKTCVRLQSLLNLRSRTGDQSPASPAQRDFPYNDGYSSPSLLCDHDTNSDKFSPFTSQANVNSQSLLQVEELGLSFKDATAPATGTRSSMPKHDGTPPRISSDLCLSTPTTPNDLANERSLRKLRRRARGMPLEFSSKNDTALDSASVLQSHQGKSESGSYKIPATPNTTKLLSACSRGRGRPRKHKLEVRDEAASEILSDKHYGGCSKENPEVMTNGGLSLSKLKKSQVPDGANVELSLKRGRGRPRKDKNVRQNSANKVILNQKETETPN